MVHVNQAEAPAVRLAEWLSIGWLTPAMDRLFAEGAGGRRPSGLAWSPDGGRLVFLTNSVLAGDSTLRNINSKMTSTLLSPNASLTGKFQTLNSIGIQLENNGMLKLDTTKLTEALGEDPDAVARILAGDDTTDGIELWSPA